MSPISKVLLLLSRLKLVESNLSNIGKSNESSNLFIPLSNDTLVSLKSTLPRPAASLGTASPPEPSNLTDELSNVLPVSLINVVKTVSSNVSVVESKVIKLLSNAFVLAPPEIFISPGGGTLIRVVNAVKGILPFESDTSLILNCLN